MIVGIYYFHLNGLFHMDIKPNNYMIDNEGWLNIIDFGLSECLKQTDLCTQVSKIQRING